MLTGSIGMLPSASLNETGNWMGEILNRRKDGNVSTMHETISAFRHSSGAISNYISVIVDVSEIQDAQTLIDFLAYHDGLTGVPNRLVARRHFDVALASTDVANQEYLGVLRMDLDRFKHVNDSLGHAAGDELLKQAARRLAHVVGQTENVARIGGDEFTVIATEDTSNEGVERLAAEVLEAVQPGGTGELVHERLQLQLRAVLAGDRQPLLPGQRELGLLLGQGGAVALGEGFGGGLIHSRAIR